MNSTWLDYLIHGGPTLYTLIACSLVLMAVIFERWTALRAQSVDSEWLLAQVATRLRTWDIQGAVQVCGQAPGAVARVLEAGLYRADHNRDELVTALSSRITRQAQGLEKNLSLIGTMAVIAPFIGLFGTVLGIVRSFKDLAGTNPAAVNAGIAEALAATAAGLFVAILSVVAFNYFKNRVRRLINEMHGAADQLVELLVLARAGRAFPQDLAMAPAPAPASPANPTVAQMQWPPTQSGVA